MNGRGIEGTVSTLCCFRSAAISNEDGDGSARLSLGRSRHGRWLPAHERLKGLDIGLVADLRAEPTHDVILHLLAYVSIVDSEPGKTIGVTDARNFKNSRRVEGAHG